MADEELPRLEEASDEDLRLAAHALGSLARYGGFMRATLAGIYAEREKLDRAGHQSSETGDGAEDERHADTD